MKEEQRRIEWSWHDHGGGLLLYLTRHNEGAGPVYRVEHFDGRQVSWNDESAAKRRAAELLKEAGHQCNDKCKPWKPIADNAEANL